MNFSLTIDVMMAKSTINSPDQDTQGPPGLNIFLNLFNHIIDCWTLSIISTPLLEIISYR